MSGLKEGLSVRYTVHQHEPVSPSHVSIPHSTLILCFHTRNEKLKKLSVNNSQSVNTPAPLQSDLKGPTLFFDLEFYVVSIDDRFHRMINRSVLGIFASIFDYIQI